MRRLTVLVDGRSVSSKFTRLRHGGNRRVATIGVRRAGPHNVFVAVVDSGGRQGFDRRRFIVGRRDRRYLSLGPIAGHHPAAPIRVRFRARNRPLGLNVTLNGKRIERAFGRTTRVLASTMLSATHGLRPGRNQLTVIAYRLDGRYDIERRNFTVASGRPLAGAGMDLIGRVGRVSRLDGRGSRIGLSSAKAASRYLLSYRWRLTTRPRGSHATLRRANRVRPTLVPDKPGTYRATLVVTQRRRGARASAATTGSRSAPDTVALDAQPPWGPIGAAVDTNAAEGTAISIGGQTVGPASKEIKLVVVSRENPAVVLYSNAYPGGSTGMGDLKSELSTLASPTNQYGPPDELLALISGSSPAQGQPPVQGSDYSTFASAVSQIGATMCNAGSLAPAPCLPQTAVTGANGSFSIIGVPASGSGAWEAPGDLTGWLQVDQSGIDYTFVGQPNNVPFKSTTGATQASITVGGQTYTSESLPSGSFGLLVLPVNAYTLAPVAGGPQTIPLSGGTTDVTLAQRALNSLATNTLQDFGAPVLVFIQSIGNIVPGTGGAGTDDWGQLAQTLESLGGTADVFLRLNGHEPYGLVGGSDIAGGQGIETTSTVPVSPADFQEQGGPGIPGTLNGMLSRQPDWRFGPSTSDPTNLVDYTLMSVAENPPVPWPFTDSGHQAANAWIAAQVDPNGTLGLCAGVPQGQLCDVRQAYVNDWTYFDNPATVLTQLSNVSCPKKGGEIDNVQFTQQDCTDMVGQFTKEWPLVARVRQMIGNPDGSAILQVPLALVGNSTTGWSSGTLNSVTAAIDNSLSSESSPSQAAVTGVKLFGDIFTLASTIFAGADIPAQAGITGFIGGVSNLALDSVTGADGANALVGTVNAQANQLITDAQADFSNAIFEYSHVADLIVSDWGKLQTAASVQSEWTTPNTTQQALLESQIKATTLQWFYRGLLPVFTKTYTLGSATPSSFYCGSKHGYNFNPFRGSAPAATYQYATNADINPSLTITSDWWVLGQSSPYLSQNQYDVTLPSGLTTSLIQPFYPEFDFGGKHPVFPAVGLYQPWLLRWVTGPASSFNCSNPKR